MMNRGDLVVDYLVCHCCSYVYVYVQIQNSHGALVLP